MSVLALLVLYDAVAALFQEEAPSINCVFGWKEPPKQINHGEGGANRVCFVPGDPGNGLGEDKPPKYPGRNPPAMATLDELFTVRVWAVDKASPNDERAQYEAARLLYDGVRRALSLCDPGGLRVRSQRWVRSNPERMFGAEIEMVCSVGAMIPDTPYAEAESPTASVGLTMALAGGDVDPNPGPVVPGEDT